MPSGYLLLYVVDTSQDIERVFVNFDNRQDTFDKIFPLKISSSLYYLTVKLGQITTYLLPSHMKLTDMWKQIPSSGIFHLVHSTSSSSSSSPVSLHPGVEQRIRDILEPEWEIEMTDSDIEEDSNSNDTNEETKIMDEETDVTERKQPPAISDTIIQHPAFQVVSSYYDPETQIGLDQLQPHMCYEHKIDESKEPFRAIYYRVSMGKRTCYVIHVIDGPYAGHSFFPLLNLTSSCGLNLLRASNNSIQSFTSTLVRKNVLLEQDFAIVSIVPFWLDLRNTKVAQQTKVILLEHLLTVLRDFERAHDKNQGDLVFLTKVQSTLQQIL